MKPFLSSNSAVMTALQNRSCPQKVSWIVMEMIAAAVAPAAAAAAAVVDNLADGIDSAVRPTIINSWQVAAGSMIIAVIFATAIIIAFLFEFFCWQRHVLFHLFLLGNCSSRKQANYLK